MTEQDKQEGSTDFTCSRCKKQGVRLDEPPFPNKLGAKIHETICTACWQEWMAMSVRVINEYRLNLMSPEASAIYDSSMCEFLGVDPKAK
jgi:Fe-S cluster biosynthesis and repair protein YggX